MFSFIFSSLEISQISFDESVLLGGKCIFLWLKNLYVNRLA